MRDERAQWLSRAPREELSRKLGIAAWIVTAAVLVLVGLMRRVKIPLPDGVSLSFLPPFHAAVNALAAVVLVIAFIAVILDCVDVQAKQFYLQFDFQELPGYPMRLFLPFKALEALAKGA